jgi:hypothetical protein
MKLNSVVVIALHSPKERIWGRLLDLNAAGVTIQGLDVDSFNHWLNQIDSERQYGLPTFFFPLHRVERIALDEAVGDVPPLATTFQKRAGITLLEYLAKY